MATERQIIANRRNAEKSTGPQSPEGKAQCRQNALTHGLTAEHMLLANEDRAAFDEFRQALVTDLAPDGALEHQFVERAANLVWRMGRIPAFEAALFAYVKYDKDRWPGSIDADDDNSAQQLKLGRAFEALLKKDLTGKLSRYETALQRQLSATLKELRELQANRPDHSKLVDAPAQDLAHEPATLSDRASSTRIIRKEQRTPSADW